MESKSSNSEIKLTTFAKAIGQLVKEELSNAFELESKTYSTFFDQYTKLNDEYQSAFNAYIKEEHLATFLFQNIRYFDKLKENIQEGFIEEEPLHLIDSIKEIKQKTVREFANLIQDADSPLFSLIHSIEQSQSKNQSFKAKISGSISTLTAGNIRAEQDSIHAFLQHYYQTALVPLLSNFTSQIHNLYTEYASIGPILLTSYKNNIQFLTKLDDTNYCIDEIEDNLKNWARDEKAFVRLNQIHTNFKESIVNLILVVEESILNFDFDTFQTIKAKSLDINRTIAITEKENQNLKQSNQLWRTTRLAFTEDWTLDIEIDILKYKIVQKSQDFIQVLESKFNDPFYTNLNAFETQFELTKKHFITNENKTKGVESSLQKLKLELKKELLIKSLPKLRNHLNSSEIMEEVDSFEGLAEKSFTALSKKKQLMKDPDYLRKVEAHELEVISPADLISFEIKPAFIQVFPAFKRKIIEHTQNMLNLLETAPSITIFSIESAIQLHNEKGDSENTNTICLEGIDRSKTKLQEIKAINEAFFNAEMVNLQNAIDTLTNSITEITNNESAFQIKMRIVKAKAIMQSKEFRAKLKQRVLNFWPIIVEKAQQLSVFIEVSSQKIAKSFALNKTKEYISTDISYYLNTTQTAISKLPYVYQRLFSFEPLDSFELFVERKAPMDNLTEAFNHWKKEKFAPVILIGEKGSGKTTFVRKFIKGYASNENVYIFNRNLEEDSPINHLNTIIEKAKPTNSSSGEKKIIIIDGLECFFETKIGGFNILMQLFQLISDTQKDIFWLVSVHSVSWEFLDKSIQASNYFGYHIYLNDLEYDELVNLIVSRHNLSGYKIQFEELESKKSRVSKILEENEKQEALKTAFFNELNKNVQGNILQAYIYWMRSAKLQKNTILISLDHLLDFDFVRSIPYQRLILLKSILINNGLHADAFSSIFRIEKASAELQLKQLADDGILNSINGRYNINPLIYKQLIKHLNNVNLLH